MNVIPGAEARATAADTFRRLYWDTALSWGDPVLRMLRDVVGIDRVLFGSDYPYLRRDLAVCCRERIEDSPELTDSERTAVLGVTATKLIPRLASLPSRTAPDAAEAAAAPALRAHAVQLAQRLLIERHALGGQVLPQVGDRAGAGDEQHVGS
jgi:Amidohydrolase